MSRYSDIDPQDIDPEIGRPYAGYSSPALDTSFHDREMGADSASDRAWYAYYAAAGAALKARGWGRNADGDEAEDGFSLDGCYDAWEAGTPVDHWLERVTANRKALGLS